MHYARPCNWLHSDRSALVVANPFIRRLRLTVVSREAKEEAATDRLATHVYEYFTGTDALKI